MVYPGAGRATSRSGRSPGTPTSWRSRHSPSGSRAPTASSSARRGRARPARRDGGDARSRRATARCGGRPCRGSPRRPSGPATRRSTASPSEVFDDLATRRRDGEFDFVERVAAPLPIGVISWILGVPRDDWKLLFRWTNEIIGKDDPEFRRPGETPGQTIRRARGRAPRVPRGRSSNAAVASPVTTSSASCSSAEIDGQPLSPRPAAQLRELIVEAGNETTRNAISGGLLAFSEHPTSGSACDSSPSSCPAAVEEILRWVSPIIHFTRTATEDCEVRGRNDLRRRPGGALLRLGQPGRGGVRRPVRVPGRPQAQPSSGLRLRHSFLHGRPPGPGRAGGALPASARPVGVVRGDGTARAAELGGERRHQAPPAALP